MSERDKIIKGMAESLWRHANGWSWRKPYAVEIPDAAIKAATDLARLYTDANEALPAMMKAFNKVIAREEDATYPAHSFGALLASAALRTSRHAVIESLFTVPAFRIEYRERLNDLTWTGDVPDQELVVAGSRVNPGDWDRDSARGYGRYGYRMERTLSQALAEARQQGIPERLMSAVQDGWAAERADTVSGGYIDPESNPTKPKDYTMREASEFAGKESHTFGEVPHTKSLAEVRNILARIKRSDACSDSCPGWAVFDTNRGFEIQVCDDCMRSLPKAIRLSDDDVAQLPEAQKSLREVQAEWMEDLEENPRRRAPRPPRSRPAYKFEVYNVDTDEWVSRTRTRDAAESDAEGMRQVLPGRRFAVREYTENPAGRFTDKGERMYEDIKASYEARGESRARAEELAARTVFARAADGVPGLVKRHGRPPGVPNGRRRR